MEMLSHVITPPLFGTIYSSSAALGSASMASLPLRSGGGPGLRLKALVPAVNRDRSPPEAHP